MISVVLDANAIIRSDWHLAGAAWRVLAYRSRHHRCRIVVPEIVVREVVADYRKNLDTTTDRAKGSLRSLKDLGAEVPALDVDTEALVAAYEVALRQQITDAGGSTPDPPADVDLLGLADLAIRRHKPFDKQGSGFRDALIWEQVLVCLAPPKFDFGGLARVVLITNDSTAFRDAKDDEVPAQQLRGRLVAQGLDPDSVNLAHSMASYIRSTSGAKDEEVESAITDLLDTEEAQIETNITYAMAHANVDADRFAVRAMLRQVHGPMQVVLWRTYPDDGDLVLVELEAEMDADIDIEDYRHDSIDQSYTITRSITVMLEATYDRAAGTLDDFSAGSVLVDEDDLAPIGPWH